MYKVGLASFETGLDGFLKLRDVIFVAISNLLELIIRIIWVGVRVLISIRLPKISSFLRNR